MMCRALIFAVPLVLTVGLVGCEAQPPPTLPAGPGGGLPPNHPTPPGGNLLPAAPSGSIVGTIEVTDALKGKVAAGDVIFVVARNAATGSIIAVTRVVAPAAFPADFELGGSDVMHTQTSLTGKVRLEARVDKDGDAMTKNPGDVVGAVADLVTVPATGVVLTLDETL
ncbi:MAG: hypothetical protein V3T05_12435 [Myxococcota bacterium]